MGDRNTHIEDSIVSLHWRVLHPLPSLHVLSSEYEHRQEVWFSNTHITKHHLSLAISHSVIMARQVLNTG